MDPEQLLNYVETDVTEIPTADGAAYMITHMDQTIVVVFYTRRVHLEYVDGCLITFDFDYTPKAINILYVNADIHRLTPCSDRWISKVNTLLNLIDIIQRSYQAEVLDRIKQKLKEAQ